MKKFILGITAVLLFTGLASAQILPDFQFGIKAGANISDFSQYSKFATSPQAGYIGGFWARVGALGFIFQPEMYLTSKNANITYTESSNEVFKNQAKFTSVDVPLLVGFKSGAADLGVRFYGGPVFSFVVNKDQSFDTGSGVNARINYNDQNYAGQLGIGLDVQKLSIDLRYEAGINKSSFGPDDRSRTRVNLFSLSLAYQIFSL